MATSEIILKLHALSKDYIRGAEKISALRGIDFELRSGEFLGLAGPSGSGKSTLLNIVGLTDDPTSGSLVFAGRDIDFSDEQGLLRLRREQIGYVFQYFNLLPSLTATENVALGQLLNGSSYAQASACAKELLAAVGLAHRENHMPQELSGGEMQRVALCRAMIHKPSLLLADEPTGNLDSVTGSAILDLLQGLASSGTAILMASHNEQALSRCARTLRLRDGVMV